MTCKAWGLCDALTGEFLGGHRDDEPLDIASTTKLMTAWLVLRLAESDPGVLEERATVSSRAADTPGSTADLKAGETVVIQDLLHGLLLPSGNDAAVVIAEHFGGRFAGDDADQLARFVAEMNRAAADLGMRDTCYRNPHGLTVEGHHSTARDLLKLATKLVQDGRILPYVQTRKYIGRLEGAAGYARFELWTNTNKLLETEGYLGMKTGTTDAAGACLVTLAERGSERLLVVVLGATSPDARYVDTRNLCRWGWARREGSAP